MRIQHDLQGILGTADARAHPYQYIPLEVPSRTARIEVNYQYAPISASDEPCTLDIGIFDVRGTDPFTGGFRGWSGSARRSFFIERESATPGYVAGPLPAGTWSIVLGGYEVPEPGLRWWLTVSFEVAADRLPSAAAPVMNAEAPHSRRPEKSWG